MIRFDFTVSDEDAGNIFDCINSEISRVHQRLLKNFSKIHKSDDTKEIERLKSESDWYRRHIDYLKRLKDKMTNRRHEISYEIS